MRRRNLLGIAVLIGFSLFVPQVFSQPSQAVDPQKKQRKVKKESDRAISDWIREVEPILTASERDAWKKLTTDEEREQFIKHAWDERDPDPDTAENEYREAYYERLTYVNEHFASGKPGYKTDRGRIYLKYGKPDEIESHPAGSSSYQLEPWEGGGSTSTYPFERWFYRHIPGRSGATIEFVDPTGTGEYRIARNPFEKMASLTVPGGAPSLDGRSQADYLQASHGIGNPFSWREEDSPFAWAELMRILDAPLPGPARDPFTERVPTPNLEDNPITFETSFGFFRLDDNRVITTITIQTENSELVFRDSGGLQVASMNVAGRVTSVAGRRVSFFEEILKTTATPEELIEAKRRRSAYQKTIILPPGHYKIDLLVRDTESGAGGNRRLGFTVPKFGSELCTSSLVLASVLERVNNETASRLFLIGDQKVIPNTSGLFRAGAPVGVYMQIYNAGIDQTTLRPAVDVEYVLLKDGTELRRQTEDWRGAKTNGERLTISRLIDSRELAPGEYLVEVRVRDHVTGQSLVEKRKFKLEK